MTHINISMISRLLIYPLLLVIYLNYNGIAAQSLLKSDTLNKKRVKSAIVVGSATYAVAGYWMYKSWYEQSERSSMHSFNDWNEWRNMDKYGHVATAHYQSHLAFQGARWCGYDEKKAAILGAGTSLLLQTTIEVMDGFSADWGFSWADMAFNTAGAGLFILQQVVWHDQPLRLKLSAKIKKYPTNLIESFEGGQFTSEEIRADELFGEPFYERLLKDYNQQTYWLSFNLASIIKEKNIPPWLNVAVGIGAENLYGGFENLWEDAGHEFGVPKSRYSQYYLAPDVDWTKIKTNSAVLKTMFDLLSIIKFPAPGLSWADEEGMRVHWIAY